MMSKILGSIQLTRPLNGLLGAISTIVGAYLTVGSIGFVTRGKGVFLASLSVFLIMSGANAINDFFDMEIDRVNRPARPLPSGRVKRGEALSLSLLLFTLGILLSLFLSLWNFLIALFASIFLFFYSLHYKKRGLSGNFIVSLCSGLVFLYGGLAIIHHSPFTIHRFFFLLFPFLFAFLFHLGREVVKDIADMEGDQKEGARTFPLRFGKKSGLRFSFGVFLLLIGMTPLPFLLQVYSKVYLLVVIFGVDLFLLLLFGYLFQHPSVERFTRAGVLLKADMGVGLLALLLGKI